MDENVEQKPKVVITVTWGAIIVAAAAHYVFKNRRTITQALFRN